jgi:hypothetical protein
MEMIALSVKTENGEIAEFQVDSEIVKGLYLVHDLEKVILNSRTYNISLTENVQKVETKIKTLDKVSIVTIEVNNSVRFQYFVGNDLGLEALVKVPENELPNNIKEVILKAYHLIQKASLIPKIRLN